MTTSRADLLRTPQRRDQPDARPSRGRRGRSSSIPSASRNRSTNRASPCIEWSSSAVERRSVAPQPGRSRATARRSSRSMNGTQSSELVGLPCTKRTGRPAPGRGAVERADAVDARRSAARAHSPGQTYPPSDGRAETARAKLDAPAARPGARDPRPAARDLRASRQPSPRAPDRRARPHDPLPEHQRPQSRRRLRAPARALPDLGRRPRRPGRGGDRGDQAAVASR